MSKLRQYFYLFAGAVAGFIPLLVAFGGLGADSASNVTEILTQIGSLIGAGAAGTAGVVLSKQRKGGVLDASAVDLVIDNIPLVVKKASEAAADLDRLRSVTADALGSLPLYGEDAQRIVNSLRF